MARRIFDIYAHDGVFSAHTLRSKADCIDAIFKQMLHLCRIRIVIVRTDRTHQRFLGIKCCCLNGGTYSDAYKKRRTCI